MKLLVLSIIFPYPSHQGSSLRMAATLEALSRHHEIYFLGFTKKEIPPDSIEYAKQYCSEVGIVKIKRIERYLNGILSSLTPLPISIGIWRNHAMQEALHRICQKHAIDAVFLFDIKMAPYLRYLPENARTYIDLDIAYSRYYLTMQSQAKGLRRVLYRLESKRMGAYEKRIINTTEGCYIASRIDRNALSKDCRESVRILPNVIDVASFTYKPPSNRKTGKIIFTGRFSYKPNRDGAIFFYEKIFSNIKKEFENATFWLVGANPSKDVKRIHDGRDVFVTGFVDDIRTHLQQAEVFACPLRLGGGTRLKILEAMAAGLPVVTTSTGCEGLNVINGRHLFIEDNPAAFAKRITAILRGEIDVVDLCKNARGFVERFHDRASLEIEGLTD